MKVGIMAIFGPKPWVNPFGNISIFRLFKLLVFIAWRGVFFGLEYRKRTEGQVIHWGKNLSVTQTKEILKCELKFITNLHVLHHYA